MVQDREIDLLLKSLDAAGPRRAGTERSRQDLERILAGDASAADSGSVPSLQRQGGRQPSLPQLEGPRRNRRWILVTAAVAVALGIIAVPVVMGGDPAFASWTRTPSALGPEASERAGNDCRSSDRNTSEETAGAEVAIAERRGEWTTVVLSGPGSFSAMCVTDGSLFGGSFGYSGHRPGGVEPAERELLPTAMGMGSTSAGELSMVVGAAGSEVSGVSYLSRSEGEVRASVANGYFVLWFPGNELRDYPDEGVLLQVSYTDGSQAQLAVSLDWANS